MPVFKLPDIFHGVFFPEAIIHLNCFIM
jgi:hypothetical protein